MFLRSLGLLAALSLFISTAAWAQSPEPKAESKAAAKTKEGSQPVTVNGKPIPKSRVDFIVKQRAAQGQPDNEQARRMIVDNLVTQEVVAQEADRKGFAKSTEVRAQLDLMRKQVLVQALIQDYLKAHPVKDEELQAEYDKLKATRGEKEYKARHILVDKDTEAERDIAQLKGREIRGPRQAIEGSGIQRQGRRTRLESADHLRQALRRCADEAGEGKIHRDSGADPLRLARHPAGRCPRPAVSALRYGEAAAAAAAAGAGGSEVRDGAALESEDPVGPA